jgi:hypothetical protein
MILRYVKHRSSLNVDTAQSSIQTVCEGCARRVDTLQLVIISHKITRNTALHAFFNES